MKAERILWPTHFWKHLQDRTPLKPIAEMNLPSEVKDILSDFAKNEFGVGIRRMNITDALEQVILMERMLL